MILINVINVHRTEKTMEVAFEALIIENKIKSLRSMDKEARLILEYKADDDKLINEINKLHSAENTVMIVIMKGKEVTKQVKKE